MKKVKKIITCCIIMVFTALTLLSTTVYASNAPGRYLTIGRTGVNQRAEPNTNARILGTLNRNQVVDIAEVRNNWGRVNGGVGGWVSLDFMARQNGGQFNVRVHAPNTGSINVRNNSNINASIIGELTHNVEVAIFQTTSNNWGRLSRRYSKSPTH